MGRGAKCATSRCARARSQNQHDRLNKSKVKKFICIALWDDVINALNAILFIPNCAVQKQFISF
jgi:hypothetical protein